MKDTPGVVWLEENDLPVAVLGTLCDVLLDISSFASPQPREPPISSAGMMHGKYLITAFIGFWDL
jgi:hypothetical protein